MPPVTRSGASDDVPDGVKLEPNTMVATEVRPTPAEDPEAAPEPAPLHARLWKATYVTQLACSREPVTAGTPLTMGMVP